ncbi:MAG: exodeoxyribonuclease VII small subunit [Rhodoferax sp.]|jgi:exodeoxyribonuclease VII small subunit
MAVKTFKEAYGVLQHHAETLREQDEPNIDDLLSIVTESVRAYQVCKERIDAVEKALEKALSDTNSPVKEAPRSTRSAPPPPPLNLDDEGDIPF